LGNAQKAADQGGQNLEVNFDMHIPGILRNWLVRLPFLRDAVRAHADKPT
jgi:hypothetical protein